MQSTILLFVILFNIMLLTTSNFFTQNVVCYQPQAAHQNVNIPRRAPQYIKVTVVILIVSIFLGNVFGLICIVAALICACTVSGYYKNLMVLTDLKILLIADIMFYNYTYVLGSEKIRLMKRKMKNEILASPVKRYNCLKLKVNIAPNVTYVFQSALLKNEIMRHKPYFLRAYHIWIHIHMHTHTGTREEQSWRL